MAVYPGKISQTLDEVTYKLHQAATLANTTPTNINDQITTLYHLTAAAQSIKDITVAFNVTEPLNPLTHAIQALQETTTALEKKAHH